MLLMQSGSFKCLLLSSRFTVKQNSVGKPLVIGEFGSQRPMDIRNGFYAAVYDELAKAKQAGQPIGGRLLL